MGSFSERYCVSAVTLDLTERKQTREFTLWNRSGGGGVVFSSSEEVAQSFRKSISLQRDNGDYVFDYVHLIEAFNQPDTHGHVDEGARLTFSRPESEIRVTGANNEQHYLFEVQKRLVELMEQDVVREASGRLV